LKIQDEFLGCLSCHAMKWRRFSAEPIHPKHLFDPKRADPIEKYLRPDICFLDIGSGVGTDCILSKRKGARISIGLEICRNHLQTAVARTRREGLEVCFLNIDLESGILPFKNSIFDLINLSNVLEHLVNRSSILSEISRVKKKEGILVLSIPNSETTWKKRLTAYGIDPRDDPDHKIEYSQPVLIEELHQAGLTPCGPFEPIIPNLPWNGVIAMSAFISPSFYCKLQNAKRKFLSSHPQETMGWIITAQ